MNVDIYGIYELLDEALKLKQYMYFEAAIKKYSILDNNDPIISLFFKYGFVTDNVKIMKKYAKSSKHDLLKVYQQHRIQQKFGESNDDLVEIIEAGYFTISEYYNVLSLALKDGDVVFLLNMTNTHALPVRFHPKNIMFNKLIYRYIGYDPREQKRDIKMFTYLTYIYRTIISYPSGFSP